MSRINALSKRERMQRREMLTRFGEDGSFKVPWSRRTRPGKADGNWRTCQRCGERTYIPKQDAPGCCYRSTCRAPFEDRGMRHGGFKQRQA